MADDQAEPLLEVSGFYKQTNALTDAPADAASASDPASVEATLVDAQRLFETGSSTYTAAADTGATSSLNTPTWGTLVAQANPTNPASPATTSAGTTSSGATATTAAADSGAGIGTLLLGALGLAALAGGGGGSKSATTDTTAPTLAITDSVNTTPDTANGPVTFTFKFSKAVTGFDGSQVTVANGTKGTFTIVSATEYTLAVTPAANAKGNITVSVASTGVKDTAGNALGAVADYVQAFDTVVVTPPTDTDAPTATVSDNEPGTANGPVTYTIAFTEVVKGFDVSKLTLTGGTLGTPVSTDGGKTYTVVATPDLTTTGTLKLSFKTTGIVDLAGNAMAAAPTVADQAYAQNVLQGTIVAGPVITGNSLSVKAFNAAGVVIGSANVSATGTYTVSLGAYSGPVVLLLIDNDDTKFDYVDEVSKKPTDLSGNLLAAGNVSASTSVQTFNINPITTVAALKAGFKASTDGTSVVANTDAALATKIDSANTAVAKALGLGNTADALLTTSIVPTVNVDGTPNASANTYGKLLAVVSYMDSANGGDASKTLDKLAKGISENGTLDSAVQAEVKTGATAAGVPVADLPAAATGGNTTSGGGSTTPVTPSKTYSIAVTFGPQTDAGQGTIVSLYKSTGEKLGDATYNSTTKKYDYTDTTGYSSVLIVKMVDTDAEDDYRDEATGTTKSADGVYLAVVNVADAASGALNVNPMTTVAAQKLGVSAQVETAPKTTVTLKSEDVMATNKAVAKALGVVDVSSNGLDISTAEVLTVIDKNGDANASSNSYGKALAVIAQMEQVGVLSTTEVINKVTEALDTTAGALTNTTTNTQQATTATQTLLVQALVETQAKGQITEVAPLVQAATGTTVATVTDTTTVVTSFTAVQVAAMTPADVAKLSATQILALGTKLALLSDTALGNLKAVQLANIDDQQATALGTKVFSFSATEVASANIASINNALTAAMPNSAAGIAALGSRLANLPNTALAALTDTQLAGINATQIDALGGTQLNAMDANLAKLSDSAVASLDATQLADITHLGNLGSQVFSLSGTAISAVTDKTNITTAQKAELTNLTTAGSVSALGSKIASLTDGALATVNATQAGGLTPLQIQALSATQLAKLAPAAFAALTATAIASLSDAQLAALTDLQLNVMMAGQMQALSATQVSKLSSAALVQLSDAAAEAMSGAQVAGLSNAQLTGLGNQIAKVPVSSLTSLSTEQLDLVTTALGAPKVTEVSTAKAEATAAAGGNLDAAALASLTPDVTSALSTTVIGQLSTTAIGGLKTQGLTAAQATVLSATQIDGLSTTQIGNFTPSAIASLDAGQVAALTAAQVAQLSVAQVKALGTLVASLNDNDNVKAIASLSAAALAGLEAAQLAAITGSQAAQLTASQMTALSATQVAQLGTAAVAQLSDSALKQLSATQVRALTATQAEALTANQIDALSPLQVASLSPAALAKLSTGANSALQILDDGQLAALTASQAAALTGAQVADLGGKLLKLSNTALSQINASDTTAMTALSSQVTTLSATQLAALSPAQVAKLTLTGLDDAGKTTFTSGLTSTQAKALTAEQLSTLTGLTLTNTFSDNVARLPAGAFVAIYDTVGGTATKLGNATVTGTGWTFTPTTAMTDQGGHSITARVDVAGGGSSTATAALAFTLDTVAPTATPSTPTATLVEAGGSSSAPTAGTSTSKITVTKADNLGSTAVDFDTDTMTTGGWATADNGVTFTKAGTYGTATFIKADGEVSYALDNTKSATQALTAASTNIKETFAIAVIDKAGNKGSTDAVFAITGANDAPTANGTINAQTAVKGQSAWTLDLTNYFADVDAGETRSYDITSGTLPAGLALNKDTGVISGTPTDESASSSYTVTMTDKGNQTASQTFNLAVVLPPWCKASPWSMR